jgi:hypothetical protein
MLTYLLGLIVGLGSLGLYLSAFFYPEIYRKGDLVWSGVGLFYALVLWVCADRITGGVLLGQMASVSLIGWFGYQTLTARLGKTLSAEELQAKVSEVLKSENTEKVLAQGKELFTKVREQVQSRIGSSETSEGAKPESYQPLNREDFGNPPVTVETQGESTTQAPKADVSGAIGAVGSAIGGFFKKPPKNTSTYVRKEFREEPAKSADNDDNAFDFEEDIAAAEQALETGTVPVDQPGAPESTVDADEIIQEEVEYESRHSVEPMHPNPPSEELVEAAIEDAAEKNIPANPPESQEETEK